MKTYLLIDDMGCISRADSVSEEEMDACSYPRVIEIEACAVVSGLQVNTKIKDHKGELKDI